MEKEDRNELWDRSFAAAHPVFPGTLVFGELSEAVVTDLRKPDPVNGSPAGLEAVPALGPLPRQALPVRRDELLVEGRAVLLGGASTGLEDRLVIAPAISLMICSVLARRRNDGEARIANQAVPDDPRGREQHGALVAEKQRQDPLLLRCLPVR